jgi:putative ubiquitin-RnfH superfamily antitoxin RatB of RatAB toxin-antitoxin module
MGSDGAGTIGVSVCHARPHDAWLRELTLPSGATAADAVAASGFAEAFPGLDPWRAGVGVFGRAVAPGHVLRDGDRVEIYRPLAFDPMESRRRRAAHRARAVPGPRPPRTPKAPR